MGEGGERRARGRTSKYTPERVQRIVNLLRIGNTRRASCLASGISEDTFAAWLAKYPDFSDAVKHAEGEAEARMLQLVVRAAPKSWQAAAWWLERRRSEDYRQRSDPSAVATATSAATAAANAQAKLSVHDVLIQSAAELREEMARLEPDRPEPGQEG